MNQKFLAMITKDPWQPGVIKEVKDYYGERASGLMIRVRCKEQFLAYFISTKLTPEMPESQRNRMLMRLKTFLKEFNFRLRPYPPNSLEKIVRRSKRLIGRQVMVKVRAMEHDSLIYPTIMDIRKGRK